MHTIVAGLLPSNLAAHVCIISPLHGFKYHTPVSTHVLHVCNISPLHGFKYQIPVRTHVLHGFIWNTDFTLHPMTILIVRSWIVHLTPIPCSLCQNNCCVHDWRTTLDGHKYTEYAIMNSLNLIGQCEGSKSLRVLIHSRVYPQE